jgi:PelA/Pel-15E family pectate lyase
VNVIISTVGLVLAMFISASTEAAAPVEWGVAVLQQDADWYATEEARVAADQVLEYQSVVGAWPKNTNVFAAATADEIAQINTGGRANTIDNDATTLQMRFLARIFQATGEFRYRDSFVRGLDYLLAAQYENGGWPQFYPLREGYYSRITFNDNAMINTMSLLRDIAEGRQPYEFVDNEQRDKAADAVSRGINCILKTQIIQDGELAVWAAQYDEQTLMPAWARAYEPPSLSGNESVAIVRFLMEIEEPSDEIVAAIEGAVAWLQVAAIHGYRYNRGTDADGVDDAWITPDPTASSIWARFYELETNRPLFLGRDSVYRYALAEIEQERRGGYAYYGTWPESLLSNDYPRWQQSRKEISQ